MTLLFLFISIFFLYTGLSTYFGRDKLWWLMKSTPVVPAGIVYGAFPAAILFFVMAVIFRKSFPMETRILVLDYVLTPLLLLSILFSMWQPRWLKPKWMRWLETYHHPILGLLREEARNEDWRQWQRRVQTQEGLEEWVAEVRQKNKLDEVDQRFIGDPHA